MAKEREDRIYLPTLERDIDRDKVLKAFDTIRKEGGVPPERQSVGYCVVHEGRHYPPKYVVCLAVGQPDGWITGGVLVCGVLALEGFRVVRCRCGGKR